jgi:hypothetical protein
LGAALFFAFALLFPDKFMNTIRFGHRWVPAAMIMLVLALPAPSVRPVMRQAAALALLLVFCAATSTTWLLFERKELSGLEAALSALPRSPRVLGLDTVRTSELIKGYPFLQMFAYSQVLNGGRLNFSFAQFSPCLVVFKKRFRSPWTQGLEWFPGRVKKSDLQYFDYAIVNGGKRIHEATGAEPLLTPLTHSGRWRLYRVSPPKQ